MTSPTTVYHAPTIRGGALVIHREGESVSWFIPACQGGWLLRRPWPRTTAGLERLEGVEARFALLKAGLAVGAS